MKENFVVDFIAEITNKDVKVIGSVFFVVAIGLVGPIDTDFLRGFSKWWILLGKTSYVPIGGLDARLELSLLSRPLLDRRIRQIRSSALLLEIGAKLRLATRCRSII